MSEIAARVASAAYTPWAEKLLADVAPVDGPDAFDLFELVGPASRGDVEAQRMLANAGVVQVIQGAVLDPLLTLGEAMMFARLAAAQSRECDDYYRCAAMLSYMSLVCGAEEAIQFTAEAIAWLEMMADTGSEDAARLLASFAETESPQTFALAQVCRKRLSLMLEN